MGRVTLQGKNCKVKVSLYLGLVATQSLGRPGPYSLDADLFRHHCATETVGPSSLHADGLCIRSKKLISDGLYQNFGHGTRTRDLSADPCAVPPVPSRKIGRSQ